MSITRNWDEVDTEIARTRARLNALEIGAAQDAYMRRNGGTTVVYPSSRMSYHSQPQSPPPHPHVQAGTSIVDTSSIPTPLPPWVDKYLAVKHLITPRSPSPPVRHPPPPMMSDDPTVSPPRKTALSPTSSLKLMTVVGPPRAVQHTEGVQVDLYPPKPSACGAVQTEEPIRVHTGMQASNHHNMGTQTMTTDVMGWSRSNHTELYQSYSGSDAIFYRTPSVRTQSMGSQTSATFLGMRPSGVQTSHIEYEDFGLQTDKNVHVVGTQYEQPIRTYEFTTQTLQSMESTERSTQTVPPLEVVGTPWASQTASIVQPLKPPPFSTLGIVLHNETTALRATIRAFARRVDIQLQEWKKALRELAAFVSYIPTTILGSLRYDRVGERLYHLPVHDQGVQVQGLHRCIRTPEDVYSQSTQCDWKDLFLGGGGDHGSDMSIEVAGELVRYLLREDNNGIGGFGQIDVIAAYNNRRQQDIETKTKLIIQERLVEEYRIRCKELQAELESKSEILQEVLRRNASLSIPPTRRLVQHHDRSGHHHTTRTTSRFMAPQEDDDDDDNNTTTTNMEFEGDSYHGTNVVLYPRGTRDSDSNIDDEVYTYEYFRSLTQQQQQQNQQQPQQRSYSP
eukprot:PhF_6_TR19995/c0_g1_i1/m.29174